MPSLQLCCSVHPYHPVDEEQEEEVVVVVFLGGVFTRAIRSTRNTRNTDPFKPRTNESLALCHPYLQPRCSVHPHNILLAPSRKGRTSRSVQIRRGHSSLRLGKSVCLLCDCGSCINYILRG